MFKIEKNKNSLLDDYDGMAFVMAAMAKEESPRYKIHNRVMFDGACFWGVDGHRVHYYYVQNNNFDPGIYEVVGKDKKSIVLNKVDGIFPDITQLEIFRKKPKWSMEIKTDYTTGDRDMSRSVEYAKVIKRMHRGNTINYKFFSDLPLDSYTVYSYGPERMIGFCNHNKGAGIMPLRVT